MSINSSLNNISSSVNQRLQTIWENEAIAKCLRKQLDNYEADTSRLKKEIEAGDKETEKLKPLMEMLKFCYETSKEGFTVAENSLMNQHLYKLSIIEETKKLKQEESRLLDEYKQSYLQMRKRLENTSQPYSTLNEKEIQLKKSEIYGLHLQQKIKEENTIIKQKHDNKRTIFLNNICTFAKRWLDEKKYMEVKDSLHTVKTEERAKLTLLLELQENAKKINIRVGLDYFKKPQREHALKKPKMDITAEDVLVPTNETCHSVARKDSVKASYSTDYGSEVFNMLTENLDPIDFLIPKPVFIPKPLPKKEYNSDHTKVRILDVQTIKPNPLTVPISESISDKLKRVVSKVSKRFSRQNSEVQPVAKLSQDMNCQNILQQSPKPTHMSQEKSQSSQNYEIHPGKTGVTQDLENFHLKQSKSITLNNQGILNEEMSPESGESHIIVSNSNQKTEKNTFSKATGSLGDKFDKISQEREAKIANFSQISNSQTKENIIPKDLYTTKRENTHCRNQNNSLNINPFKQLNFEPSKFEPFSMNIAKQAPHGTTKNKDNLMTDNVLHHPRTSEANKYFPFPMNMTNTKQSLQSTNNNIGIQGGNKAHELTVEPKKHHSFSTNMTSAKQSQDTTEKGKEELNNDNIVQPLTIKSMVQPNNQANPQFLNPNEISCNNFSFAKQPDDRFSVESLFGNQSTHKEERNDVNLQQKMENPGAPPKSVHFAAIGNDVYSPPIPPHIYGTEVQVDDSFMVCNDSGEFGYKSPEFDSSFNFGGQDGISPFGGQLQAATSGFSFGQPAQFNMF